MAALTIFQHGAEYKDTKLILTHLSKVIDNGVRSLLHENWVTLFKHPLNDTAAVLVQAICNNVLLDLMDEVNEWLRLHLLTHLLDYLLHHVISIETEGAFLHLSLVKEFLNHLLLLLKVKHFNSCLNHSASMLI